MLRISKNRPLHIILSVAILIGVAIYCLTPLYWIIITSFKPQGTEFQTPVRYIPRNVSLQAYRTVFSPLFKVHRAVANSLAVSSAAMVGTILLGALAAYVIARLKFRHNLSSLIVLQIAGMLPPIIVIAPTFVLLRYLGILRTLTAMILPNMAYGLPLASWLIASYFSKIPYEIEDTAKIDGATSMQILFRILLPCAAPGLFSAGVLAFLGSWGEFMLAFTVTQGRVDVQTVPIAVLSYSQAFELQWTWICAGVVVSLIPIFILVFLFQRFVVQGLTAGAIK